MSLFSSIDVARTGVGFARYWMDTISHNVANVNTQTAGDAEPFRARFVVAKALTDEIASTGSGTAVAEVREDERPPARVFDPANPNADENGNVTMPVVDLAGQLTDMMLANRTYQANVSVLRSGEEAYRSALRIGRN